MKDKTLKPVVKSAKKTARAAIQLKIVSQLKVIAKEFGQDSEDLVHELEKGAKKLARKISEQLKITTPAEAAPKESKPVKAAAKPKAAPKAETAAKPKPAVSEKKVATPAKAVNGTAKKVTAKTVAAKPVKKEEPAKAKTKAPAKKS